MIGWRSDNRRGHLAQRSRRAFTLVELLVVLSIIAILITILTPSIGRAKEMARKAVCASRLHAFAVGVQNYVSQYDSYPLMGVGWDSGWPKLYGVLEMLGQFGSHKTHGLWSYENLDLDEVWEGALCPSMDAPKLWDWVIRQSGHPQEKVAMHPAAIGYQWNVNLRAADSPVLLYPLGRFTASPYNLPAGTPTGHYDATIWIDYWTSLPSGSYLCQAVRPSEVQNLANCAEAWDGWDLGTAPNLSWPTSYNIENNMPGWHVGPQMHYTNGRALLNAVRHTGGPNVLYADGTVRSDVRQRVDAADLGALPGGYGSWTGIRAVTWPDYNAEFGTVHHVVPRAEIITQLPWSSP